MSVNIENGNKNYRERIEKLRLEYPSGIPAEEVIMICQDLEIYYLLEIVKSINEKNLAVNMLTDVITKHKNYITFSTN